MVSGSGTQTHSLGAVNAAATKPKNTKSVIVGAGVGTFIEWLDYASYAYLAAIIAGVFFDNSDPAVALIEAYGLFALSFLMRPVGGLFWSHFGDRIGRQRILAISVLGMGAASVLIGLLPTYASIGMLAPTLLLILRMTQSFCAAGEYSGAAVLLFEHAPAHQKARWVSVVPISTTAGFLVASALVTLLTGTLSEGEMQEWGWRVPFLLSFPLTIFAWLLRRRVEESPVFLEMKKSENLAESSPLLDGLAQHWRPMLRMLCVASVNAGGYYLVLTYMATYIQQHLGLDAFHSSFIVTAALLAYLPLLFVGAWLADKIGRRAVLLLNCFLFLVLSYPAFVLLGSAGFGLILLIQIFLVAVFALNDGSFATYFVESFPAKVRFTGFALPFNVGVAMFGGFSPFAASWLINKTGNLLMPAFIIMAFALVGGIALLTDRNRNTEKEG